MNGIVNGIGIFILSKQITDVSTTLVEYLKISGWISDTIRGLGYWLYELLGSLVNMLDGVFQELIKVDLSTMISIGGLNKTLDELTWYMLFFTLIGVVFMKLFSSGNDFSFLRNVFVIIMSITIFLQFTTFMNLAKNSGIKIIGSSLGKGGNITMSDKVFHDNSYDMLASIDKNKLMKMNSNVLASMIDINEQISKSDLQGKYVYDGDGRAKVKNLSDGFLGFLDERYYRYDVNFLSINITLIVMMIFFFMGGFKIIYIMWDLFIVQILGAVVISTSVNNLKKVGNVFGYVCKSTVTFLITYGSMMVFSNVSSAVFGNANLSWLAKVGILVGFGFVTLLGTGFVSKGLGLDDGSNFVLKSMFAGRMLSRMGKGAYDDIKSGISKTSDVVTKTGGYTFDKVNNVASDMIKRSEIRKMKEDMNSFFAKNKDNFQKPKLNDFANNDNRIENKGVRTPSENEKMIVDETGFTRREVANASDYQKNDYVRKGLDVESKNPYDKNKMTDKKSEIFAKMKNKENVINKKKSQFENMYGKTKSYADYKRDYAKGDKTIIDNKKDYQRFSFNKKKLPDWFENDEKYTNLNDFNENELYKDLDKLRNKENEKGE